MQDFPISDLIPSERDPQLPLKLSGSSHVVSADLAERAGVVDIETGISKDRMIQYVSRVHPNLHALRLIDIECLARAQIETKTSGPFNPPISQSSERSRSGVLQENVILRIGQRVVGALTLETLQCRHPLAPRVALKQESILRKIRRKRVCHLCVSKILFKRSNDIQAPAVDIGIGPGNIQRTPGIQVGDPGQLPSLDEPGDPAGAV